MQRRVVDSGVLPVALGEEQMLLSWMEQSLTGEGLPVCQALGQGLAPRLGQQQQTDDAQQGATSKDHVMQEVALLVVELHDGGGEHAEASAGQDQAQAATPGQRGRRLCSWRTTYTRGKNPCVLPNSTTRGSQ